MKKVVKKQLKEDEFVSTLTKIFRFAKQRIKEVLVVAAVVAFLILLYVGLRFLQVQNLKKQSQVLSELLDLRAEIAAKPENLTKLEQLANKGRFARVAYVLEATSWVEKGDLEKAKAALAKLRPEPKDFIYFQAQDLLGQVNVLAKNYDEAVAIYKKLEEEKPKEYGLDVILFHKGEALEGKGDKTEALAVYKKLQEEYPQSYYSLDAAERARKIEGAT